jgi:mRNA interferase RelE/StbE
MQNSKMESLSMYRIFETETFLKSLEQDFGGQKAKIKKKLREYVYQQLKISPRFGPNIKTLKNWEPPTWRYRISGYRFFYEIDEADKIVSMILAEHRSKAY